MADMTERSKFQFRMRDLLWAVGLIGVSLAPWAYWHRIDGSDNALVALIAFFASAACFGAGVGCIWRKPDFGAVFGGLAAIPILAVLLYVAANEYSRVPRKLKAVQKPVRMRAVEQEAVSKVTNLLCPAKRAHNRGE
jgi:hypothetical protein